MHGTIEHAAERYHRVVRRHSDWTLKEHEVVVSHWPDICKIRELLPHRTKVAIQGFAGRCNLRRYIHFWTTGEDALLKKRVREGIPRKEIAAELKMHVNQVQNRMQYIGLRYGKRPPEPTGHRLMDSILYRAFQLNMNRRDLDAVCGGRGTPFSRWSPSRKICIKKVAKAVEMLGGGLDAVWEPLEK